MMAGEDVTALFAGVERIIIAGCGSGFNVAYAVVPTLQFLVTYKSLAVGCDPDHPRHLSRHVQLTEGDGLQSRGE